MTTKTQINVVKRNGSKEPLDINKFHKVVELACEGISGVSVSEIELKSQIKFFDGMKTSEIQETLIKAAAELISEENPNYQYVAANLVNYHLRKDIYGDITPPDLYSHVKHVVKEGFYTSELLELYSEEEFKILDSFIDHDRDYNLVYIGIEQFREKYLVKNRVNGKIYETPQMAYMLIAASLFSAYPPDIRLSYVKEYYDVISKHYISLPTPIMAGVRTKSKQYSSCVVINSYDSLNSIIETTGAITKYIANRAGIGINAGRIRAKGSLVRGGEAYSYGIIPYLRMFSAATKSASQGSIREGASTVHLPIWHLEIEDCIVLKNNKGTPETRIRDMDYSVQLSKLFYQRLLERSHITLFCPNDVPELYESFFRDQQKFKELYEKAERNTKIRKKKVKAEDLFASIMQERKETGRIYIMNVDHCNEHGAFISEEAPIYSSNLCLTGDSIITIRGNTIGDRDIQLEDLKMFMDFEDINIYSFNEETGTNEFRRVLAYSLTQYDAKILEIEDTVTGNKVKCTPNHKIYTKNRGYVMAEELNDNDILKISYIENNSTIKVKKLEQRQDVYDITVETNHNFYANNILVHNCQEICLNNKYLAQDDSTIALCTLSSINWAKIEKPSDFEKVCELTVRALDALLDYQNYPLEEAKRHTLMYRPLGIGVTNLAYFLARRGLTYDGNQETYDTVNEYAEAWSYYMYKASVKLAKEFGRCEGYNELKVSKGILPIHTYSKHLDDIIGNELKYDWSELAKDIEKYGIRNSTLLAIAPVETSSQILNSTNGIEPPRGYISYKESKNGIFKQLIPGGPRLRKAYQLLWDIQSPKGYLTIAAILNKYMCQSISTNTSYNPKHYKDEKIPMSILLTDLLYAYKLGIKTLYYCNTNKGSNDTTLNEESSSCDSGACSI